MLKLLALGLLLLAAGGCDTDWLARRAADSPGPAKAVTQSVRDTRQDQPLSTGVPQRAAEQIVIGSFNIQVLGTRKLANVPVTQVLVDIVRQFDVLAIQELRSVDQAVIPTLVALVNAQGALYNYVIGPRQGNSSSKEQYVFLYDTRRIELIDPGFVLPDPGNRLHREPLATTFRTRCGDPQGAFTFTLVNMHTDPDVVESELEALADSLALVRNRNAWEDDVILLGDLNASAKHFYLLRIPNAAWAIDEGTSTNTARNRCYDNLVFDAALTGEYTGVSGVVDVQQRYGLTLDQAREVSDHLPIYAVFSAREQPPWHAALTMPSRPR